MKRYYLIRRKLENFLGPMTPEELRDALKRLEFGSQDEVCGHCGKWVTIEDSARLRQYYPELAEMLGNSAGNWAMSGPDSSPRLRKAAAQPTKSSARSGTIGFALLLIGIGLIAGLGAFYARNQDFPSKFFADNIPTVSRADSLLQQEDYEAFSTYMNKHLANITARATKNKSGYKEWIPYLRSLAFLSEGEVPGIKPRYIQGAGKVAAPADCSVGQWKQRWIEGATEFNSFASGLNMSRKPWARALLWDPHWIRRRAATEGWKVPANYYSFCLEMAKRAWDRLKEVPEKGVTIEFHEAIERRLDTQLLIINGQTPMNEIATEGGLRQLNCLDSALTTTDIAACRQGPSLSGDWQELLRVHDTLTTLRTQIIRSTPLDAAALTQLGASIGDLPQMNPVTSFEYVPELRFAKLVLLNQGNPAGAMAKITTEFPELDFSPPK